MIRLEQMPMTPLRRRFIDDMRLLNYSARTIETYVTGVVRVAKHFNRSPDLFGPDDIRSFQLELLKRRVSWCLFNQTVCATVSVHGDAGPTGDGRPHSIRQEAEDVANRAEPRGSGPLPRCGQAGARSHAARGEEPPHRPATDRGSRRGECAP
ncbi:MAG: phage integrase N-terminal SAM-like domain-containing protein [Planctomycetes bacterium]|nr:phage integrase N-terminal SAM-like domain-containing protein [Planctomycetota bacterium]